jgi:hypothetical protein
VDEVDPIKDTICGGVAVTAYDTIHQGSSKKRDHGLMTTLMKRLRGESRGSLVLMSCEVEPKTGSSPVSLAKRGDGKDGRIKPQRHSLVLAVSRKQRMTNRRR